MGATRLASRSCIDRTDQLTAEITPCFLCIGICSINQHSTVPDDGTTTLCVNTNVVVSAANKPTIEPDPRLTKHQYF